MIVDIHTQQYREIKAALLFNPSDEQIKYNEHIQKHVYNKCMQASSKQILT